MNRNLEKLQAHHAQEPNPRPHARVSSTLAGFLYTVFDGLLGEEADHTARVSITVKKGLLINNVSVVEGDSGITSANFTVTLTMPASELDLVTVSYRTADGTAIGSGVPIVTGVTALRRFP